MKGSSKVVMGATLVMAVLLAVVLGLVLVLLAELYCSLLQRRRRQSVTATSDSIPTANPCSPQPSQTQLRSASLASFYSQGVLCAPRSFLFPAVSSQEDKAEMKKQHSRLQPILELQTPQSNNSPHRIGLLAASPPPPPSPSASPKPIQQGGGRSCSDGVCGSGGENFIYISNPIYDNEANRTSLANTPFQTPDTSPSRLEMGSSSSGEDEVAQPSQSRPSSSSSSPSSSPPSTPPLTPMKKLPAEACSVSLRDARSLGTSGSDSNSINGLSSSSSGSPCTSPSW